MYLAGYNARARARAREANIHVVNIGIGNVIFPKILVSALPIPEGVVLIGMDLIGKGKFTVQNMDVEGETKKVLTLELP